MVDKETYEENKRIGTLTLDWLKANYDKWKHGDLDKGEAYVVQEYIAYVCILCYHIWSVAFFPKPDGWDDVAFRR